MSHIFLHTLFQLSKAPLVKTFISKAECQVMLGDFSTFHAAFPHFYCSLVRVGFFVSYYTFFISLFLYIKYSVISM